ncbi:MAG: PRC-barrel domain-containing protein [Bacteroidetes bacterium]|nr:PRC-barrel domain-containing protein [Bacteroidota bacterium]
MLHNTTELYGDVLSALDGEIGSVKDFYFDDNNWVVRYLIVDTGSWLTGRAVLLSPHSFGNLDQLERKLNIQLTMGQIEKSPSIESHLPVSRQYERDYFTYYGFPAYWDGGGMWGAGGYPMLLPTLDDAGTAHKSFHHRADKHLRSTQAVTGYTIHATDGEIGKVSGFMVDEKNWAIRDLVVETGSWFTGKEIKVPVSKVDRISYEDSTVYITLTKEDLQRTPEDSVAHHS